MTKHRKSRHNPIPPPWYIEPVAVLTEDYQRQIDRSTGKLEREYARAEKRAQQAELRLHRAQQSPRTRNKPRQLAELTVLVEIRRAELDEIRRLMNHSTAGRGVMHRTGREERLEMGTGVRRRA